MATNVPTRGVGVGAMYAAVHEIIPRGGKGENWRRAYFF
jgi:hypothetical protein